MASFQSDSGFSQLSSSPEAEHSLHYRARRGSLSGVYSGEEARHDGKHIVPNPNIKKLKWRINSNPHKIDDDEMQEILAEPATQPPLRAIHLEFPQSLHLVVRSPKHGATVKEVLDVIYKKFKKRADDELMEGTLIGLGWSLGTEKRPRTAEWDVLEVLLSK